MSIEMQDSHEPSAVVCGWDSSPSTFVEDYGATSTAFRCVSESFREQAARQAILSPRGKGRGGQKHGDLIGLLCIQ